MGACILNSIFELISGGVGSVWTIYMEYNEKNTRITVLLFRSKDHRFDGKNVGTYTRLKCKFHSESNKLLVWNNSMMQTPTIIPLLWFFCFSSKWMFPTSGFDVCICRFSIETKPIYTNMNCNGAAAAAFAWKTKGQLDDHPIWNWYHFSFFLSLISYLSLIFDLKFLYLFGHFLKFRVQMI